MTQLAFDLESLVTRESIPETCAGAGARPWHVLDPCGHCRDCGAVLLTIALDLARQCKGHAPAHRREAGCSCGWWIVDDSGDDGEDFNAAIENHADYCNSESVDEQLIHAATIREQVTNAHTVGSRCGACRDLGGEHTGRGDCQFASESTVTEEER